MKIGLIGSGSWATAIAKVLNDNEIKINWWVRKEKNAEFIKTEKHNPDYLESIKFNTKYLNVSTRINQVVANSDLLIFVIPSAYILEPLNTIDKKILQEKKIISAIKGIIPNVNVLLNEYLLSEFKIPLKNYFSIMGPCHAEEVAVEKLSYITFSGIDIETTKKIAHLFNNKYMKTLINNDIWGSQYSCILKNIYAVGAGIAHGLRYGDNFMSVYNANCARELDAFLNTFYTENKIKNIYNHNDSVYLGDLLVTCYSPFSRNREFGTLIGKGHSSREAQIEMNMVAEGYNTSKCIFNLNKKLKANIPIIENIFEIVWNKKDPTQGFKNIETIMH